MGATSFSTIAFGKTPADAFRRAQAEARHWNGHGGYTGTIAEKPGFSLFTLPPRITSERFERAAWEALNERYNSGPAQRLTEAGPWLIERIGARETDRLLNLVDEKWSDAVCVMLGATEAKPHLPRTASGAARRGYRAYRFFGMASC